MRNFPETESLVHWFKNEQRDFPWRHNPNPYAIWVSEVMLQQTQASVVIPYFERWMSKFPTLKHLAESPLEEVIKLWEGLGYYSRARNLHAGAQYILKQFGGIFPETAEELSQIKGLGPYTVGAILSFAFHQRAAAVDGNVLRVLSRYYGIEEDISKNKTVNSIRTIAQEILPEDKPWIFAEALIELGATICQKKANCAMCPLASTCQAFKLGKADKLPYKSTKTTIEKLYRTTLVLTCNNQILVKKVPDGEIMAGLYEFPYLETTQKGMTPQIITKKMKADWNIEASFLKALPLVRHSFTRYQAHLFPMVFDCSECFSIPKCQWLPLNIAYQLPFSSGHKRVLETIKTSMTLHTTNRKAP